ncbi:MAG TPA: methyltransferase domain-containing protein [Polyangiaceae bacterium]|nr:methyltransferase domain-containing protein [Polyangiaceae bacterium]
MAADPTDRVRASYDAMAERYAELFAGELEAARPERGLLDCLAEACAALGGPVADVGCGPAQAARYLRARGLPALGVDLSPRMVEVARALNPGLDVRVGSLTALGAADGAWAGAVALYAIIHLDPRERPLAFRELARALRPGGWLLVSFHVSMPGQPPGSAIDLDAWQGVRVNLRGHFLAPDVVAAELAAAGFAPRARLERGPWVEAEVPSLRCYLLAQRGPG